MIHDQGLRFRELHMKGEQNPLQRLMKGSSRRQDAIRATLPQKLSFLGWLPSGLDLEFQFAGNESHDGVRPRQGLRRMSWRSIPQLLLVENICGSLDTSGLRT